MYGKESFPYMRDFRLILGPTGSTSEGVYGKDMISVQASACTENQGLPYLPRMRLDSKHRNVGFLALSGR